MRAFCIYFAAVFSACGGGSSATPDASLNDASEDACSACDAADDAGPPPANAITIVNAGGDAILTFAGDASGDVAPVATLAGDQTGLASACALALDGADDLYVATPSAILVFAPNASGNVAPTRTIAGPAALAQGDQFVALAVLADGTLVAASQAPSGQDAGTNRNPKVMVFPPNANGDVAPSQTINGASTNLQNVSAVSVFFTEISVADTSQQIFFFRPSDDGNVAPVRTLDDPPPGVVEASAFDAVSALFLARYDAEASSIISFIAGAHGNPTPLSTLVGAATGLTAPAGVAVDSAERVYVANADPAGASILIFAPNANGNVAPERTIAGPTTTLTGSQFPMPIVVH